MHMTEEGLALIRHFEGFRAEAYRCPAGVWTIGYGHTAEAGPPAVKPGMRMSEAEARAVLARDVDAFASAVRAGLTREVSPRQFSALVSFAFNVGTGAFARSSVLKAVNEGRLDAVPGRLKLWVKARGRVLPGLVRRRAAEAAMFAAAPAAAPPPPREAGGWWLSGLIAALVRFLFAKREKK
jgi:lysozyme